MIKINNVHQFIKCPFCESLKIYKIGNIEYFQPLYYSSVEVVTTKIPELWKCKQCNSAFVQNIVDEADSIFLYQQGESSKRFGTGFSYQLKTDVVAENLMRFLDKGIRILDVGCNTGEILDFAKSRGCETFGLEYSLDSLNQLRNKGHKCYSHLNEVNELFDIITAFDLVEHLYNLPSFIETCLNFLSPNGHIIFLTGDINCIWARLTRENWWYVRYCEHIMFPSKKYFESHSKIQLVSWLSSYADRAYDRPKHLVAMSTLKRVLLGNYSGLPALTPDHVLIIFKHKDY